MGNDSQSSLTHLGIFFMQVLIEVFIVGLDDVGKSMQQVSHGNDDVILDNGVGMGAVEQSHHMGELLFAEVRTETHELTVRQHTDDLQLTAHLEIKNYLLNDSDPPVDKGVLYDFLCQQLDLLYLPLQLGLSATHDFVEFLFVLLVLLHDLFLFESLNLVLDCIQVNEAFQTVV